MLNLQTILSQLETAPFLETLLSQSALVILMGFAIYVLWKKLEAAWKKIEELAEALIKITLLWEERYSKESQDDKDIKITLASNHEAIQRILELIRLNKDGK